jgi:hypothetical protein
LVRTDGSSKFPPTEANAASLALSGCITSTWAPDRLSIPTAASREATDSGGTRAAKSEDENAIATERQIRVIDGIKPSIDEAAAADWNGRPDGGNGATSGHCINQLRTAVPFKYSPSATVRVDSGDQPVFPSAMYGPEAAMRSRFAAQRATSPAQPGQAIQLV